MTDRNSKPQIALGPQDLVLLPSGEITGTATGQNGQVYRVLASPETDWTDGLETLDLSWVGKRSRRLLLRWAILPGMPSPVVHYKAGAITPVEYCIAALSQRLMGLAKSTPDTRIWQLDVEEFAGFRADILAAACPLEEQGTPAGRQLVAAFTQAWRRIAFEIRAARMPDTVNPD